MNELKSYEPSKFKHPIPLPYPVIALAWIVMLLASYRFFHEINLLLWFVGPGLAVAKIYFDAEVIGYMRANPEPRLYSLAQEGVYAELEQTIKTLPGYFKNLSFNFNYQLKHPPKGLPMQLHAIITLQHPGVDKTLLPPAKQYDMKSILKMEAAILKVGNKTQLTYIFKPDPLLGRQQLDDIILHICQHTDYLVSQRVK